MTLNLFEIGILDFIQQHLRTPVGDAVMPVVTVLGNGGIFWICMTLALLIYPKTRRLGLVCAVSLIVDVALCNGLIKNLVARTRPYVVNPDIALLVPRPGEFSFPSGHAAASFAVVGALFFNKSKLWIPAGILALIIAFSRLYLYVHYPTDVIAGMLFGILFGYLGTLIVRWAEKRLRERRGKKGGN